MGWMDGLGDGDGYMEILGDTKQKKDTEGCVKLDGPQGGTETARKRAEFDGCKDFWLDGPQGGRCNRSVQKRQ
jgi:hypothetical protein